MNISENTKSESNGKKLKRLSLGRIDERKIGTQGKPIKTTARNYFVIICSFIILATGILCPVASPVYAEAVGPLPDGFDGIDLSDILITFPSGAGAGIKNQTVLTDLYNNYGVSGWGVADMTPYFDIVVTSTGESAGLSNDVLNQHLGDNEWFQNNGYDIKVNYDSFKQKLDATESLTKYGANYIHQATLSPSTGNPWEWDWSSILEEYFKTGLMAFEHTFVSFDTLNDIAVTMQDVLENVYDFWTPNIQNSIPVTIDLNNVIDDLAGYDSTVGAINWISGNNITAFYWGTNSTDVLFYCYKNSAGIINYGIYNYSNSRITYKSITSNGGDSTSSISANNSFQTSYGNENTTKLYGFKEFSNYSEVQKYCNGLKNGDYNKVNYSPDLINPYGNISIEDFPDMSPSIEQGQAIRPIPQQAYQNWAMTNNLQDPAENGALMGALVTPYIEAEPAPAPSPAPDDPWADPVPDTEPANRPVSPTQPDMPEEPELTDEQINESLLGATPDLTEIFPFCIPWDIARIFKQFTANRKAPYIEWTFKSELFGFEYTFEIDMAIFDDVATILRLLELIGFILGLAILTRYLIGAS